ncbi:hypothetical protein [Stenomitos frigidus]|nr:hypothetical protein [Stenomitos frigidus]
MSQNLLIPNSGTDRASMRSRCLRQYVHVGFRFARYQCAPWLVLAIAPLKLLFTSGVERIHAQVRYFSAISRIDFVGVYGLLNDLLW